MGMNFSRIISGLSGGLSPRRKGLRRCSALGLAMIGCSLLWYGGMSPALAQDSVAESVILPVEKRSPEVRITEHTQTVLTISPDVIAPFTGHPLLMEELDGRQTGRVLVGLNGEIMFGQFSEFIAEDVPVSGSGSYVLFRPDREITDPLTGEPLAVTAQFLGLARPTHTDELETFVVTQGEREIGIGDRLVAWEAQSPLQAIEPAVPSVSVDAYVASTLSAVGGAGSYSVVIISGGENIGIHTGDLLTVRSPERQLLLTERDHLPIRTTSACNASTSALLNSSARIIDCAERIPSQRELTGRSSEIIPLPPTDSGEVVVFRVFERVSFALIRKASRAIAVGDWVGHDDS